MHDLLLERQQELSNENLVAFAAELGLEMDRFNDELNRRAHAVRVAQDVESADLSGVSGTPTFFINGQRHYGAYDIETLTAAVETARLHGRNQSPQDAEVDL
jgi:protein-disulfide isomerase